MPLAALALVLVAAVMHAGWNLIVKQAKQKQVFTWWALLVGVICFLPFLIIHPQMPARVWPYVISSAVMEAVYIITLTWAYHIDDFSLVYPIARGTAPALLAIWAMLFLGEPPRTFGVLGLAVLVLGLIVVGSGPLWSRAKQAAFSAKGILVALLTACAISIYSAIDGAAVKFVSPTPYTVLVLVLTVLLVAPVMIWRYGTGVMVTEWRMNWRRILVVGVLTVLTYMLVLQAYAIGRVSYAGAIRESSIVFAAFAGWRWLGEGFGLSRLLGALLICAGIVMIALLG